MYCHEPGNFIMYGDALCLQVAYTPVVVLTIITIVITFLYFLCLYSPPLSDHIASDIGG